MKVQRQEMQASMLPKHESGFHEHVDSLATLSSQWAHELTV
jgi:hypothetical protein